MKNLNILFLALLTCFLIVSCDKEDVIDEVVEGFSGDAVITGNVTVRAYGIDTFVEHPSRSTLVFLLGQNFLIEELFSALDSTTILEGQTYVGDQWYATQTNNDGDYFFEDVKPFEDWKLQVFTDIDSISGADITPDGDVGEQLVDAPIHISLEEGEVDDGNNFLLSYVEQTSTSITGVVAIDLDGDGIADEQKGGINLNLYQTDETGDIGNVNTMLLFSTITHNDGSYRFGNVEPGNYAVQFADQDIYNVISSGDESPDADPLASSPRYIPTFVETNEIDDQNNFLIEFVSLNISGNVLIDSIDGIGAPDQRVALHARNDMDEPMGSTAIAATYTNNNGAFYFQSLPAGEYVLYLIGDGSYNCVSSSDQSQESGEPDPTECFFIPVDIPTAETEDRDNIFIVE